MVPEAFQEYFTGFGSVPGIFSGFRVALGIFSDVPGSFRPYYLVARMFRSVPGFYKELHEPYMGF